MHYHLKEISRALIGRTDVILAAEFK